MDHRFDWFRYDLPAEVCDWGNEISGALNPGKFVTICVTINFWRRTLHH